MSSIFLFSLIVGGGLLAVSLLGDLLGGGDADADAELDAAEATGGDFDGAGEVEAGSDADLAGALRIFTVRNLTYFLFGFGAIGWLLERLEPGLPGWVAAVAGVVGGALGAGLGTVIFGWVRATESGWQAEEASFVGCEGRVILPLAHGRPGRIMVRRGHREYELRALPFRAAALAPEQWRDVVVVEMEGGTARVSPMEALAPASEGRVTT